LYNKCVFCGFEGEEFEEIIRNQAVSSNGGFENMIQVAILLKCPKCGYQRRFSYGYSNDKRIADKISKKEK
jgi:uncharacterized Zn finger protein